MNGNVGPFEEPAEGFDFSSPLISDGQTDEYSCECSQGTGAQQTVERNVESRHSLSLTRLIT